MLTQLHKVDIAGVDHRLRHVHLAVSAPVVTAEYLPLDLGFAEAFRAECRAVRPVRGGTGHELENRAHAVRAETAVDKRRVFV